MINVAFNPNCKKCLRLAQFLADVKRKYPEYHAAPVAPFGGSDSKLLIVGLAPGMHGANATGRPFTGDYAGLLLYKLLYEYGFSNHPESVSRNDGLKLIDCTITNAVKCLPPDNKPVGAEISNCSKYLQAELFQVHGPKVILALGHIAHNSVLRALGLRQKAFCFEHNGIHQVLDSVFVVDSYHCSRYNMNTKRLTEPMFRDVFRTVCRLMDR